MDKRGAIFQSDLSKITAFLFHNKSIWLMTSLLEQLLLLQVHVWYKWTSGLIKLMKNLSTPRKCIANWCTVNANGMYEQLPHEKLWPCIRAIESKEQQSVVQR
uniref:Uncharacterized protein n=1 Tax=Romanomermis culicivorax TaxID=13658 RepID=A0A915J0H3_ROMCU